MAYSKGKGLSSTTVNSTPIILIVIASWANRRWNLGFESDDINVILGTVSIGFYWIKNWWKNK